MMRRDNGVVAILSLLALFKQGACHTLPGKPKLTSCRSPDKETFTCWWEPGSDGGLPTSYALLYSRENSDAVYECTDYQTAGKNSCFFNKNDTSIWVNYNITVAATNALGSNYSDPVDVDVIYIVQPHTPENVTVVVLEDKEVPFLRVSWNPPHKADTRSGWITLIYELRVKLKGDEEWEEHYAGQQKIFNIFSLRSGGVYMIEVRCKPDHGFWSEWSTATYVRIPNYIPREHSMWILTGTFSAFLFIILTCILSLKRPSVKHLFLPPVPGPKIKGFDNQLLKNGKSEEVFNALVIQGFPPTSSDYEDLLVEYLEVYVSEEQELIMQEGKDPQDSFLKSKISSSDSDSGRGSCDSHTLLMEKCGEGTAREEEKDSGSKEGKSQTQRQPVWENLEEVDSQAVEIHSPDSSDERVNTWPSVFSPNLQCSPGPSEHGLTETTRQLYLSDSLFSSTSANPLHSELGGILLGKNPPPSLPPWRLEAQSEFNISSMESKRPAAGLQLPPSKSLEYVEVQRVNRENMLVLQPLSRHSQEPLQVQFATAREDYSKVKGVVSDSVLLLQREMVDDQCTCDDQEREWPEEGWHADSTHQPQEKMEIHTTVTPAQELGIFLAPNGYVDTATMLPTF
ncbi:prolactin receptor a [Hypomesus transpacificus]|uniref:prolactin receptor a n=1 Tax=Hypomesus transpacificus TaxID=137520 RepID=UPI001F07E92F|nr:prolactin receptor a [Hypomesus transpacificus]